MLFKHLKGASSGKTIGLEAGSAGLSYAMGEALKQGIDGASWMDITGMLDEMRLVKSIEEQRFMKRCSSFRRWYTGCDQRCHSWRQRSGCRSRVSCGDDPCGRDTTWLWPLLAPVSPHGGGTYDLGGDGEHHGAVFLEIAGCVARYNAPMGRLVNIGRISDEDAEMSRIYAVKHLMRR